MGGFYMLRGSERIGPSNAQELVAEGLAGHSMVWQAGFADWVRADTVPELAPFFTPAEPSRRTGPHRHGYTRKTFDPDTLALPAVMIGVAIPVAIAGFIASEGGVIGEPLGLLAVLFLLGSMIFYAARVAILVYRCWNVLAREGQYLSPGSAVALVLIPFVELIGNFYAIHGLAKSMEEVLEDYGRERPRIASRANTYCILQILVLACSLMAPVAFLYFVFLSRDLARAAGEIVECQEEAELTRG